MSAAKLDLIGCMVMYYITVHDLSARFSSCKILKNEIKSPNTENLLKIIVNATSVYYPVHSKLPGLPKSVPHPDKSALEILVRMMQNRFSASQLALHGNPNFYQT